MRSHSADASSSRYCASAVLRSCSLPSLRRRWGTALPFGMRYGLPETLPHRNRDCPAIPTAATRSELWLRLLEELRLLLAIDLPLICQSNNLKPASMAVFQQLIADDNCLFGIALLDQIEACSRSPSTVCLSIIAPSSRRSNAAMLRSSYYCLHLHRKQV